jgi:hypothetical protein
MASKLKMIQQTKGNKAGLLVANLDAVKRRITLLKGMRFSSASPVTG